MKAFELDALQKGLQQNIEELTHFDKNKSLFVKILFAVPIYLLVSLVISLLCFATKTITVSPVFYHWINDTMRTLAFHNIIPVIDSVIFCKLSGSFAWAVAKCVVLIAMGGVFCCCVYKVCMKNTVRIANEKSKSAANTSVSYKYHVSFLS